MKREGAYHDVSLQMKKDHVYDDRPHRKNKAWSLRSVKWDSANGGTWITDRDFDMKPGKEKIKTTLPPCQNHS
ncbi:hypothetical protein JW926_06460 [Candidatus Sumerlaeota bacterium]|nr:hypothetical protein [Candidatus Sumerlaeota bacterium]